MLENDINGVVLLDLDDELLGEMGVAQEKRAAILQAVGDFKSEEGSAGESEEWDSDSDEEHKAEDPIPATATPSAAAASSAPVAGGSNSGSASAAAVKASLPSSDKKKRANTASTVKDKKKDPLRLAAQSRAVADLERSTVTSGFLWKIGGSGLKPKHWKRRFFVLTDDNCLYYFKSPKDVSALGLILLPSYTVTTASKSESVGGRQFAFKVMHGFACSLYSCKIPTQGPKHKHGENVE